jgi:hypothetical protein
MLENCNMALNICNRHRLKGFKNQINNDDALLLTTIYQIYFYAV